MVAVYVTLIVYGRRTFDSVPDQLKEAVKADLFAMGLDTDGIPFHLAA
jgi:dihydrofolate reductase